MDKVLKIALVCRVCPYYRVPVYRKLAEKCDLTVYYGRGTKTGANQNSKDISGFKAKRLATIAIEVPLSDKQYFLSIHPSLLIDIFKGTPEIVITEGTTNFLNNLMLIPFCKFKRIKLIWWDAGRDISKKKNFVRTLFEPLLAFLFKQADAFIVYGHKAREYFISYGIRPEKISIAQNTIDTTKVEEDIRKYDEDVLFQEKKRLGIEDKSVILYSGAIEKRKKIENLLIACKELENNGTSNIALLIIGDGNYLQNIKKSINEINLKNVYLLGRKTDDIGLYFLLSDLVVLPGESTLAVNQAMAYGKPVITVAAGGPEYELIDDTVSGFIVKQNNVEELKCVISRVLHDISLKNDVGKAAQNFAKEKATIDQLILNILKAI